MLLPVVASADAVKIGDIYYNLIPKGEVAEVARNPNGEYTEAVNIPEKVTFDGVIYNVTSIGDDAFAMYRGLTSVTIPQSVTIIKERAFYGCSGLTSIIIPNSVTSIGDYAFQDCSGTTSISIPNSLTSIGTGVFKGWTGLTSLTIPNTVTSIGDYAFDGCSGLTSITIPNSVTSIGDYAFIGCSGLSSITIPNSVTSIGSFAFQYCSDLTSLTIPNSMTDIGEGAFYGCSGLTSITIPNSVTSIGIYAFYGCSGLTSVTIGNSVTDIGESAFSSCPELLDIYCNAENVPNTDASAFNDSYIEYVTLHVPESSIEDYKITAPWSSFKDVVPLSPHTLTYYVDGEVYKTYLHEEGMAIPEEPAPEKEGYTFSGWSEIPETMPDQDVEVTGTFTVNKYNLIYMVDGEEYRTVEIEYGAEITPEESPEKEGYTFMGWNEIPETMPANDVTVEGIYEKNLLGKCATPTIAFKDGEFTFSCETEGVEFVSEITISDAGTNTSNKVSVTGKIKMSVYATKDGYENSDTATMEVDIRGKKGDVNGDGEVNAVDLTKLIEILLQ